MNLTITPANNLNIGRTKRSVQFTGLGDIGNNGCDGGFKALERLRSFRKPPEAPGHMGCVMMAGFIAVVLGGVVWWIKSSLHS